MKESKSKGTIVINAVVVGAVFTARLFTTGELDADGDADEDDDWEPGSNTWRGGIGNGSQ